jgi:catechol 2,3-dioxygenase
MEKYKIPPKAMIGHIHLTVSDLDASLKFYRDLLGFEITQEWNGAVFLSAGGYHHHLGLNTWSKKGARKPESGQIGLYHFAILYPSRKELAKVLKRLLDANYPLEGASDHGVSEAVYLKDPDGNSLELYTDRNKKDWPKDKNGNILMYTKHLDIQNLLKESINH